MTFNIFMIKNISKSNSINISILAIFGISKSIPHLKFILIVNHMHIQMRLQYNVHIPYGFCSTIFNIKLHGGSFGCMFSHNKQVNMLTALYLCVEDFMTSFIPDMTGPRKAR